MHLLIRSLLKGQMLELLYLIPVLLCFVLKAKTIAEQMANRVHAKLGYRPPTEEEKQAAQAQDEPTFNGDLFKRYEVDLEINDFPQTARWKVTSKVSVIPNRKLNSSNLS